MCAIFVSLHVNDSVYELCLCVCVCGYACV